MTEPSELVGVAERRLDFLERLAAEPLRKHELVDALGHSRSTVNRAIDELEAAGLVAGETDGYRTTLSGRLLAAAYREFLTVADDLAAAGDVLDPLGADVDVDPAVLRGAETYRAAAPDPYRPLEVLDEALANADSVAAALPAFPYPRIAERLRRAAAGGGTVDLTLADRAYRHAAERFADDLGAVARRDDCRVAAVDAVDAGVVAADGTALLLTFDDAGTLHGAAASTEPEAVAWAETKVRELVDRGRDVGEALAAMDRSAAGRGAGDRVEGASDRAETEESDDSVDEGGGEASDRADRDAGADGRRASAAGGLFGRIGSGDDGRRALSAQGFHAVDADRLSGDPDPYGPLRATASFPEVDAGYVLDRTTVRDGDRRSIAGLLVDGLAEARDHALVGPPGSGKSTVCRCVAVEWFRSGCGPVTYRPSDGGDPFSATERLRERVTEGDGHHLVVVEDAVYPDAAEAVGVARELADRDDVSFLFDAREEPYDDPNGLPLSPADLRYRREMATVRMPRLDEREVERFVDHVADRTGSAPAADPAALLADVRRADDERVGELLALVHRLVRATGDGASVVRVGEGSAGGASEPGTDANDATAGRDGAGPESGLEAAVAEAVREARNRPPPTADVAVLVNLLNVAGVADSRTLAYALVDGPNGSGGPETGTGTDGDESPTVDEVRRALDRLVGSALVRSGDGEYRAVHDEWSVLFLERLVEREPGPVVARRVGRAVSRVLALADDPARRARVRRAVGGDEPTVNRIERDPSAWAAETVRAVYGVGRRYPRLAPLYGRVRCAWIELPDACPDDLRNRPPEWVARMYVEAGDLDGARAALDAWRPADEAGAAERQRGYGDVARRRGEYDAARERYERAEELFAAAGDRGGLAAAIRGRAQAAHFDGDYEVAYEAASRAYAIAAEVGDPIARAKALMDAGNALDSLDGTDAVLDHYRVAGDLFRAYDDTHGEANVRANLAVALRRRGDLDAAERTARRALDGYRTVGDEHREAISLLNLAAVAEQRGAVGEAVAHASEARATAERIGSDMYEAFALSHLGSAAHLAGDLDRAERFLTAALDGLDRLGADTRCAMVTAILVEVAIDDGDLPEAARRIERTASLLEDHVGRKRLAELDRIRGRLALARGDGDAAAAALTDAVAAARTGGFTQVEAQALAALGAAEAERGDTAAAAERLIAALDLAHRIGSARAIVSAADRLADLLSVSVADSGPIDREALTAVLREAPPEPIPAESAADPAAYRAVADRWRVDGDGVAVAYPALG